MLRSPSQSLPTVVLSLAVLAACSDAPPTASLAPTERPTLSAAAAGRYVILGANGVLPANLAQQVAAAGGTLEQAIPEIGVAFASSPTPIAAASIVGAESVTRDLGVVGLPGARVTEMDSAEADVVNASNDTFYPLQWAPPAVQAPAAWAAGFTGLGARVAVLDGGLFNLHPDLAANVDVAHSTSFVAGFAYNQDLGTFWHGTHVAGIVAAIDNNIGVVGIAPQATIIGVKVLHGGTGSFESVINGIYYASTPTAQGGAGAHIINMSLGATIDEKDQAQKAAVKELAKAIDRATRYANDHGTTVIASAGNSEINFDVSKTLLDVPAMSARVIGVSATAPLGWALGATDFSRQASYTNTGKSIVTLAAPGGDFALPGNANCTMPIVSGTITRPCWVFDLYLSTSRGTTASGGYSWAAGTSMAAPVVSGIAALVVQKGGGLLTPAEVKAKLLQGAIDLGKAGKDEVYGFGWANAYNSVR